MSHKLAIVSMFMLIALAAAYLLFLFYALQQMKTARADGLAKIDSLLDSAKTDDGRAADNAS